MSNPQKKHYDLAIVGGGIVGLAHALAAARQGLRTAVFERHEKPRGASARNFGMLWPIGQNHGLVRARALRSLETWRELFAGAGIWSDPCGSLLLARREEELDVLSEFLPASAQEGYDCVLLSPAEVATVAPGVRQEGLLGALHSRQEILVNPTQALSRLTAFLRERHGTSFYFGTEVHQAEAPSIETTAGKFHAERALICSGSDFETLFPATFRESGITRCKLQMMKTAPQPGAWKLGAMVTDGLTFRRYQAFRDCPSYPLLQKRILAEHEELDLLGITVLAAQNGDAEVILGDSHHYAWTPPEAAEPGIDEKIISYLQNLVELPRPRISERWSAVYSSHPQRTEMILDPADSTRIVLASGGNGLTTSFALAEEAIANW